MTINHGLVCPDREKYLELVVSHPDKKVVLAPDIESAWRYGGLVFRSMEFEADIPNKVRRYLNALVRWIP